MAHRMTAQRLARHAPALLVVVACAVSAANLWLGPGILNTRARGDSPFLIQRTSELIAALASGDIPARWMPDAAFGLAYPFFNFYAALPYYAAAGFKLAGFDILTAIKAVQTLGLAAAAATMWLYTRERLGPLGAAVAAAAYTTAPFHLVNAYVRGDSLSELYAFVWFPLILWALDRAAAAPRASSWLALGGAGASLIVTHNVSALLFAPFAAVYAMATMLAAKREARRAVVRAQALAVAVALGLSAWFWAPALAEAPGVQLDQQTTGYFSYANHFRGDTLVQWSALFDYATDAPHAPMQMGAVHAAAAVLGLCGAAAAGRRVARRRLWALAGLFIASTFMMLPASAAVWEYGPLLKLAQFPWRMLSVQAVFASALAGFIAPALAGAGRTQVTVCGVVLAAVTVSGTARLPYERLDIRAVDVTPQSLAFYEWFSGNIGTTVRAEYLPRTVQPRPWTAPGILGQPPSGRVVEGDAAVVYVGRVGAAQRWSADVRTQAAAIVLPRLFAPGMALRTIGADGQALALSAHPGTGWAEVRPGQGTHTFDLVLGRTPVQLASELVTLATVAAVLAVSARAIAGAQRPSLRASARASAAVLVALVAASGVGRLAAWADAAPAGLLTVDFERRPFPHRSPVVFQPPSGSAYALTGARMSPAIVRAGDAFELALTWQDGRAPPDVEVVLESPSGIEGPRGDSVFVRVRDVSPANQPVSLHVVPPAALPGPLLPRLVARAADGQTMRPSVSGQALSEVLLYGLVVSETAAPPPNSVLRQFAAGVTLHELDWFAQDTLTLCIRPTWSINRFVADGWKVSFRLRGSDEREIAVADTEPLAGAAPVWSWTPGRTVLDSLCKVPIRSALRDAEPYVLDVIWYRAVDGVEQGRVQLSGVYDAGPLVLNRPR